MMPDIFLGNGSFRSYSRSDPGSLWSYSLSVRSFGLGHFSLISGVGRFGPNFGGLFLPTLFFTGLIGNKNVFLASPIYFMPFYR